MASGRGRRWLYWVSSFISWTNMSHATPATVGQGHCRGGVVVAFVVLVVDQTQSRLAVRQKQADSSLWIPNSLSRSRLLPNVLLLTVGLATCAAHIGLGILEDHARVFNSEDF